MIQKNYLKFGDLLGIWELAIDAKFQHNMSNIVPDTQKTQGHGGEYQYIVSQKQSNCFTLNSYITVLKFSKLELVKK